MLVRRWHGRVRRTRGTLLQQRPPSLKKNKRSALRAVLDVTELVVPAARRGVRWERVDAAKSARRRTAGLRPGGLRFVLD